MISDLYGALRFSVGNGLFVDELMHGVVTLPFVFLLYYKTKSIKHSLVPLAVTYLIDMDHWVDYLLFYGADISFTRFLSGEYFEITQRAIVPLHAWEWLAAISIIACYKKSWRSLYAGVAMGVFAHLLWDSQTVGSVIFYSILFRVSRGFIMI